MIDLIKGELDWHETINSNFHEINSDKTGILTTLDEHTTHLNENAKDIEFLSSNNFSAFLNLEMQPSAKESDINNFCNADTWKYEDYITKLYEPMREKNESYISRENLGKDTSNTYDIYKYEFTPNSYENTVILVGALHGNEVTGALALYRMLYNITYNYKKYPQLNYIRNRIKLVVIPFANPYGLNNGIRHNSNGVDLNRNFNYKWDSYTSSSEYDYKGESVASEKETQYLQNVIDSNSNAIAYLDFHSLFNDIFYFYTPWNEETNRNVIAELNSQWKTINSGRNIKFGNSSNPSAFCYAANKYGINSCNAEFGDGMILTKYGATEITECTKYFINILIKYVALGHNAISDKIKQPYSKLIYAYLDSSSHIQIANTSTIYVYNATEYKKVEKLEYEFNAECDGIINISGEVTLANDTENSLNFICPYIYQDRTFWGPGNVIQYKQNEYYFGGNKATTLSFSNTSEVLNSNGMHGNIKIGIFGLTTTGICKITRYKLKIDFIPSSRKDRLSVIRINNDYTQEKLY